jgi:hypothetical protein
VGTDRGRGALEQRVADAQPAETIAAALERVWAETEAA